MIEPIFRNAELSYSRLRTRTLASAVVALAFALGVAAQAAPAQTGIPAPRTANLSKALSMDEAVTLALSTDPRVESADLDWKSASAQADSTKWKSLPSLSAGAGYTRLSELPTSDTSFSTVFDGYPVSLAFPSLLNEYSFGLNLEWPVYDGNKEEENTAMAGLEARIKDVARETARRSLVFEVRKAYWEAVRANYNVSTLEQNLELMKEDSRLAAQQFGEGVATRADQLGAQMRLEQAAEDLTDARALRRRAFLALASLVGMNLPALSISTAAPDAAAPFELTTKPDTAPLPEASASPDETALVSSALARRPETRTAELECQLAEHAIALSRSALYPTVALTGNYTLADPNQRAVFQTDPWLFTGTWALGLQVTYDIGGIPAALDDVKSRTLAATKAKADEESRRQAVVMDVETCIVDLERAMRDLGSTESMVAEAEENLRVMQGRMAAGTAKDVDLRSAKFDLLRMDFAVTNRRIDALIARADLERATASEDSE
ncbi:MAG: TolC family protein [Rectinemataceae bacterium]